MTHHYRITEWKRYQHYKDRSPPWIKLHRDLLTSRTWVMLDDASRVLAVACMLIAADTDNEIPADRDFITRRAFLHQEPDFAPLVAVGFLEEHGVSDAPDDGASTMLANRTKCSPEERRGEESRSGAQAPRTVIRFKPPTVTEVREYVTERDSGVDPEAFVDFYQSKDWMVGKNRMKDWKAAVRTWERNGRGGNGEPADPGYPVDPNGLAYR